MKKGFTLIELLAVIVILAIIALIAVPIIMGIINDSRDSAKQRSLELYKNAIANEIATSQLTENPVEPGNLSSEFLQTIKYDGERISCTTNVLNTDGTIYLAGCTVGNSTKLYSYGKEVYVQVYKPQYYIWQTYPETAYLGDYIPETNSEVPPEGKTIYLGYNLYTYTWDQITYYPSISVAYVCFKRNGNEYCLISGGLEEEYEANLEILRDAFGDAIDDPNYCTYYESYEASYHAWFYKKACSFDGIAVEIDSFGNTTSVSNDTYACLGDEYGYGNCRLK